MKVGTVILIGLALLLTPLFQLEAQIPGTLSYQAYLSDPSGIPKADDNYTLTFSLYDVETDGEALWTETKELEVKQGLFHTYLGDVESFPTSLRFDRPYWLGIQVSGEPTELTPRIALTSVGYSFSALRADSAQYATRADTAQYVVNAPFPTGPAGGDLSGTYPDPTIAAGAVTMDKIDTSGVLTGQAIMFDGSLVKWQVPPNPGGTITKVTAGAGLSGGGEIGDVELIVAFAGGGLADSVARSDHVHAGEDLTSGTVAEARIDAAITRDDEIMPAVLVGDGSGSGLNADSLDGFDSNDFAAAAHSHTGSDITSAVQVADSAAKAPWSGIANMPIGFADGVDDTGGDGHSLDAADSDPADAVYVDNDGNVGIGTTNPVYPLHVIDTVTTSPYPADVMAVEVIPDGTIEDGFGPAIMFKVGEPGQVSEMARIASVYENQGNSSALAFYTYASRSLTEGVRIDRYGNVGIGTPEPVSALDVSGTVTAASLDLSGNASVGGSLAASTLGVTGTATADSLETSSGASIGGSLTISGGQVVNVVGVTDNYTTTTSDRVILCSGDPQNEVLTVTLHSAANAPGQLLAIKNIIYNMDVEIYSNEGESIEGTSVIYLSAYYGDVTGVTLVSDGGNWWIISTVESFWVD